MSVQHRMPKWVPLLLLVLAPLCLAQAPPKADPKKEDKEVVDTRGVKRTPAATIDFQKSLGLPFPSLNTLGSRIDTARKAPDPIALANAAHELHVAEKVSGKKAAVTSADLLKESLELSKMRQQVAELKAMLHMTREMGQEEVAAENLKAQIADAEERNKLETAAVKKGGQVEDNVRKLIVNNNTGQYADIYVNGHYKMQVPPYQSKWCVIEHKWNPTVLMGYGNEDMTNWGPRYIWGAFKTYTWNFN